MRVMANMKVFVPCDAIEARKATEASVQIWGPVYLRFGREKTPVMTTKHTPYAPGEAYVLWEPPVKLKAQAVIIGCGPLLYNALLAAKMLEEKGVGVIVLNSHTIKPLDAKKIVALAKKTGAVVTVEEHQVAGGLGGAVAELLAREAPTPIEFIGMQGVFGESGTPAELISKYGMGEKDIVAAVKKVIRRK
jgi:transketolase